jgi:pSer/pThr/pTyr-binding forkhead associated (FHA) protein
MSALKHKLLDAIEFLIQVESGPDKGKMYRIRPPQIVIGRDPSSQIVLTDPKVSRQQCVIKFSNDVICIDLSSRKTTKINGKPCHNTQLRPGDKISFGDTTIKFNTRTSPEAKPQLPGSQRTGNQVPPEKQAQQKRLQQFLIVIALMAVGLMLLNEDPVATQNTELLTQEAVNQQIEDSKERMNLLRESREEQKKLGEAKYLYNVENHFITGFRDFQNSQYGRAIDSFGTTIATDQNHQKAQRYARTAKKKRDDLIDTHMRDGVRYREKMMYKRCAAEFEKAIVLINNINSERFQLAKTQLEECRLLQAGGH